MDFFLKSMKKWTHPSVARNGLSSIKIDKEIHQSEHGSEWMLFLLESIRQRTNLSMATNECFPYKNQGAPLLCTPWFWAHALVHAIDASTTPIEIHQCELALSLHRCQYCYRCPKATAQGGTLWFRITAQGGTLWFGACGTKNLYFPMENNRFLWKNTYSNGFFGIFGMQNEKQTKTNGYFGYFGFSCHGKISQTWEQWKLRKTKITRITICFCMFLKKTYKNKWLFWLFWFFVTLDGLQACRMLRKTKITKITIYFCMFFNLHTKNTKKTIWICVFS